MAWTQSLTLEELEDTSQPGAVPERMFQFVDSTDKDQWQPCEGGPGSSRQGPNMLVLSQCPQLWDNMGLP